MASSADIRAGRAFVELYLQDNKFTRGLAVAEKQLRSWGGKVSTALSKIPKDLGSTISAAGTKMLALSASMAVPLGASVKAFANVQTELAKLQAAANPTADELDRIRKAVNDISKATGTGPAQVAGAFTELLKAGTDVRTALGGAAETVVKFAKVAEMDAASAAVLVSDALHIFGKEGLNAAQIVDILAQSADASSIGINDVSQSFAMASAVAGAAGIKLKGLAAAIGILGNMGLKGSAAGTSLKTMLLALAAPSNTAAAAMAKYGIETRDATGQLKDFRGIVTELTQKLGNLDAASRDAALKDIFGANAIRPALILMQQGVAGWDKFTSAMAGANGVGEKFDILMNTTAGSMERMWAAVQRAGAAIGEALAGPLTEFAQWVESTAGMMGQWVSQHEEAVVTVAKLTAGLAALGLGAKIFGPIIAGLRMLGTGMKGLAAGASFLAANPIVAAVGASAAIPALSSLNAIMKVASWHARNAADANSRYSSSSRDITVETKAEHEAMVAKLQRLEELRTKQVATDAEMEEAAKLAADLTAKYPDLAEEIRKVGDAAGGTEKALAGMNAELDKSLKRDSQIMEVAKLQDEQDKVRKELRALDAASGRINTASGRINKLGGESGARDRLSQLRQEALKYGRSDPARAERARKAAASIERDLGLTTGESAEERATRRAELAARQDELQNQITDLLNPAAAPESTPATPRPETAEPSKIVGRTETAIRDAQIDAMREGLSKTLAKINAKYDDMAKEATTGEEELAIETARWKELHIARDKHLEAIKRQAEEAVAGAAIAQIDNEHEREIAEIRHRYADLIKNAADEEDRRALEDAMGKEIDAADAVYGKRQAAAKQQLDDDYTKEAIRYSLHGREQQIALLRLEREQAMREAAKTGADTTKIDELYNLRELIASRSATSDVFGQQSGGTFSAQAAALMGQGTAQERTAKATEESARTLKQIARKTTDNWIGI
jgi:TP901 family phage tail tape measure protein